MKNIKILIWILLVILAPFPLFVQKAHSVTNADYTATPPFIGAVNQPNVMIILDNSGSMNDQAYSSAFYPGQFSPTAHYYGYFDATKNYKYFTDADPTKSRWKVTSEMPADHTGTKANPVVSGDLMNWATSRRVDISKKLLIGGKTNNYRVYDGTNSVRLYGENSSTGWNFQKDFNNGEGELLWPFTEISTLKMAGTQFSIDPLAGNPDKIFPSSNIFQEGAENGIGAWVSSGTAVFSDNMDLGRTSWTADGLWHLESGGCKQVHSGTTSWYYGSSSSCNYDANYVMSTSEFTLGALLPSTVRSHNSGHLTSRNIVLPSGAPQLSFWYYYETENSMLNYYDQRWVQISTDGGTTYTNLVQLGGDAMNTWINKTIDLSAYAGLSVNLMFNFDTIDAAVNAYKGWYIDDVSITSTTLNSWHIETGSDNAACKQVHTGNASWYYGSGTTCNYRTSGQANSGTLTSKGIPLPSGASQLSFWYYYQTESSGTTYDQRWVQISTSVDSGVTWSAYTNLAQLSADTMNTWTQKTIDLSAYASKSIKLRFYFDTIDTTSNDFKGWYIDDIVVSGPAASCGISTPASWVVTGATSVCDAVDETTTGGDTTTYTLNKSTTATDPFILNYNYYNTPDYNTYAITSVTVNMVAKVSSAGSKVATRKLAGVLQIGGTNYTVASTSNLTTSYTTYTVNWPLNPKTGVAWTWADIKQGGIVGANGINGFGVQPNEIPGATIYPTVTQVYMQITVENPSATSYNVIVDQGGTDATGIVDTLSNGVRFGLAYYNTDAEGANVAIDIGFNNATAIATSIDAKTMTTMTPLAESLYNIIKYFKQDATPQYHSTDYKTGIPIAPSTAVADTHDPYYFNFSATNQAYVPCAKSFILFLTDGEPTSDTNIPTTTVPTTTPALTSTSFATTYGGYGTDTFSNVALWMRQQNAGDIRYGGGSCTTVPTTFNQCIPDKQSLVLYPIFLFGRGSNLLKNAAINGGFDDLNVPPNNKPDCTTNPKECYRDSDGNGVLDPAVDLPLTYFEGDDGYELQASITNALSEIMKRGASGTSVSILATSAEGEGALYQAYFYPDKILPDGTKRDWVGYCRGLFVDSSGNLREDTDQDAKLVYKKDNITRMRLDTTTNLVYADLYKDVAPEDGTADSSTPDGTPSPSVYLDDLKSIWEGGDNLANKTKSERHIYAWIDKNNNGTVDDGDFSAGSPTEALSFKTTNAATFKPYLRAATDADATNIINFITGTPVPGFRNRCMPNAGSTMEAGCGAATERDWPLGDIIYSTPTVVSGAREQYDQIYGGKSANYSVFKSTYNNRRQVVYVGANDGMLHAFNGGVFTAGDDTSTTSDTEHGTFTANSSATLNGFTNGWTSPVPSLGEELWAFVPYDNLPHLSWLTSQSYSHVYYVDLKPKPTDVRIFCDSNATLSPPTGANCISGQATSHPGGWGTILIVGMRLGGGAMDVSADFGSGVVTRRFKSSYYALDVTNPEIAPKLLWRFTDANLGFTTSYPVIAHIDGTPDKWFMVVGSGPDNNVPTGTRGYEGTSTRTGSVYVVNILNGTVTKSFATDANAFMGDATSVDGDLDFTTDIIYLGAAISTTSGKVYGLNTNKDVNPANWTLSTLINTGKPLLVGPSVSKDSFNNLWVFFGSGRMFGTPDKSDYSQQTLYGVKDGCWKGGAGTTNVATVNSSNVVTANTTTACPVTYSTSNMMNSTNIAVCTAAAGGGIYDTTTGTCGSGTKLYTTGTTDYAGLLINVRSTNGWYVNLTPGVLGTPSERVLSRSVVLGGLVLYTTFTPTSDICGFQGNSAVYALYYETGTAYIKPDIGTSGSGATETVSKSKDLGKGMPTTVGIAVGKKTKGYIQTSTGAIVEVEAVPALSVRSGAASWRQTTGSGGTSEVETIYKHITK